MLESENDTIKQRLYELFFKWRKYEDEELESVMSPAVNTRKDTEKEELKTER